MNAVEYLVHTMPPYKPTTPMGTVVMMLIFVRREVFVLSMKTVV